MGCSTVGAVQAQAVRRAVTVGGRRVKTIDVHAHCGVPAAMALMGLKLPTEALLMSSPAARMRAMDEQGIDVEALSINPYWYGAEPRSGPRADPPPERGARRGLRGPPGALRGLRVGGAAAS